MTEMFEKRSFRAGETIFVEGDAGDAVYIVESGRVRIWRAVDDGERTLGYVESRGVFGEMSLINDKPRMASATADADAVCSIVPRDDFLTRLGEVNTFVKTMIKILAANIHSLTDYVEKHGSQS